MAFSCALEEEDEEEEKKERKTERKKERRMCLEEAKATSKLVV